MSAAWVALTRLPRQSAASGSCPALASCSSFIRASTHLPLATCAPSLTQGLLAKPSEFEVRTHLRLVATARRSSEALEPSRHRHVAPPAEAPSCAVHDAPYVMRAASSWQLREPCVAAVANLLCVRAGSMSTWQTVRLPARPSDVLAR